MTVCVAAICDHEGESTIICASDRMRTSGDIEFEQAQRKIHNLSSSISIMIAGDIQTQTVILHEIIAEVEGRIQEEPQNWWQVKEVAELFYLRLSELKRRRSEQALLFPLGLTFEQLTSPSVSPELAARLAKEVFDFQIPRIEALVIGIDYTNAHIYEVNNDGVICQDWVGFSSIGSGGWHASSQLMFGGHVKSKALAETMLLVYTAKKRAEVAPGVGEITDMIMIGPGMGTTSSIGLAVMTNLTDTYKQARAKAEKVRINANSQITAAIEAIIREPAVQSQAAREIEATNEAVPANPAETPGGTIEGEVAS